MKISNPGFCIGFVILGSTWPINALYLEDAYPIVTFVVVPNMSSVSFSFGGGGGLPIQTLKGHGHEVEYKYFDTSE
jgi:hypothetical protein